MDEIYTSQDLKPFNPKKYFAEYHYYEEFDSNEHYYGEQFEEDYWIGKRIYKYMLFTIRNIGENFDNACKKYIVAKEYLFDQEREQLAKHCPCPLHSSRLLVKGKGSSGCLVNGNVFVSQDTIDRARKRRDRTLCTLF